MAHQTEVVLLLLLAMASTAFANDFDNIVKASKHHDGHGKCPIGWIIYEGRCFTYQAVSMDWASAEQHCMNLGAHLVSIHSENEYQMIKAIIRAHDPNENEVWIGLNGCQKKFTWFWSDGSRVTFTKWNPNEPNFVNAECCVNINDGGQKHWNDISCNYNYKFVCARNI